MAVFTRTFTEGTHVITASGGVQMTMLLRTKKVYFTDFIEAEVKDRNLQAVINGSFIDMNTFSRLAVALTDGPLAASESTPIGPVIRNGQKLAGSDGKDRFHFSLDRCGTGEYSAGPDAPPKSACAAIGGVAPIIIGGLSYGSRNLYKPGVPAGAPPMGDVPPACMPYLIQKSNAMFRSILARGRSVGKVAIGYASASQKMTIVVQANGRVGYDADGIRSLFVAAGANNAVFLDCSDSATLFYGGKFLVRPGEDKNEFLTVAVGFM